MTNQRRTDSNATGDRQRLPQVEIRNGVNRPGKHGKCKNKYCSVTKKLTHWLHCLVEKAGETENLNRVHLDVGCIAFVQKSKLVSPATCLLSITLPLCLAVVVGGEGGLKTLP